MLVLAQCMQYGGVMDHGSGITRCTGWSMNHLCWLNQRSLSVLRGEMCMHSRQAMALCCGIFTYTYSSVDKFGIQYKMLNSSVKGCRNLAERRKIVYSIPNVFCRRASTSLNLFSLTSFQITCTWFFYQSDNSSNVTLRRIGNATSP